MEAAGGAAAAKDKKSKKKVSKKLTKADKDKLKNDQWIDLAQDEQLPAPPANEKFTGPSEKGGPSEACKRKAGDHHLLYFQDMGFDDDMLRRRMAAPRSSTAVSWSSCARGS